MQQWNLSELSEPQKDMLEQEIQQEMRRRMGPKWDLSTLTDKELSLLRERLQKEKSCLVLDFRAKGITRANWPRVLAALAEAEMVLQNSPRAFVLRLGKNQIQDREANELFQAILESKSLKSNLTRLELPQNQLGNNALLSMKEIVTECPRLELLDVSLNYIYSTKFRIIFDLARDLLSKIKWNVY